MQQLPSSHYDVVGVPPEALVFIYALVDPRDDVMFYVGQTCVGAKEPEGYIRYCHRGSTGREMMRHLRRLHHLGLKAYWVCLEECTREQLDDAERFWIAAIRAPGAKLTNMTDGGQGPGSGHKHTPESKAKIGAKSRLKVMSSETRRRIGDAVRVRVIKESTKLKLRKPKPADFGAKVSKAKKGVPRTAETTARMIAEGKNLGRPRLSVDVKRNCCWCGAELVYRDFDRRLKQKRIYCNVEHMNLHRQVPGWNR